MFTLLWIHISGDFLVECLGQKNQFKMTVTSEHINLGLVLRASLNTSEMIWKMPDNWSLANVVADLI